MGWQQAQDLNISRVRSPYCPFKKFCIFLHGEGPESVLAKREYLRERVDSLGFAMDFPNHQLKKLQERVKELEEEKDHIQKKLSDALRDPFTKTVEAVRATRSHATSTIVLTIRQRVGKTICPNMTNADAPEVLPGDASRTLIVFLYTIH